MYVRLYVHLHINSNRNNMNEAIEIIRKRIQEHKETIESFYMNDSDFVNAKFIKELNNLIKEDETIIKLLSKWKPNQHPTNI